MSDKEKIKHLESQLSKAIDRIHDLEALILQLKLGKTSKNSHKAPSTDLSRKNQSLRPKSDKPVGGQPNHKGTSLKMSQTPDKVVALRSDFCSRCGQNLTANEFTLTARRQVIDIPPILPFTTEYQRYATHCSCGNCQVADFPQGVDNHVQYGPNIQSLAVYQSQYQYLPFKRLQDFFSKICNVSLSQGTIANFIRRAAERALPAYEAIHQAISRCSVVGSDETSYKLNGKKGWFWVWQNRSLTYIVAETSRSKQVILDTFPEGLPNSILCSDRLAAQLSTTSKGKQLCLAHLLRDLNYLIEAESGFSPNARPWALEFKELLQEAIKLKQKQDVYARSTPECIELEQKLDNLLNQEYLQLLIDQDKKYKQTLTFFLSMSKLKYGLFPFLYHKDVPFENNGSERAIRMIKVKTKISGQFKALQKQFAIIRSVIDTAIKNGQSVFDAIAAVINCYPKPAE